MPAARHDPIRPDWVTKTLAGLVLGLCLALIASALLMTQLRGMPLAVGGLLGTAVAALLARTRRRTLLDTVFQLVLVLAIMAASFSSSSAS